MKCIKCGAYLTDDTKFCSYCGAKIMEENNPPTPEESETIENDVFEVDVDESTEFSQAQVKKSATNKVKEKFFFYWNKMDLFSKIAAIVGLISVIFLIVSILRVKIIPLVFSLLQVGGVIAAFLIYKGKIKSNLTWMKFLILGIVAFLTFVNISSYSWFGGLDISTYFAKVAVPYSSNDCIGKDKDTIVSDFYVAGFSNIEEKKIEDLDLSDAEKYGIVETISINDNAKFNVNDEFKASSTIVISYHAYKRIEVPISHEQAKSVEATALIESFEKAGFVNIKTEELYDLNPDDTNIEFENRISIDGSSSFGKDSKFPLDAEVKITTHRPYKMCNLKVIIDFVPNLIFSKYDVEFEIDGNLETLSHGNDATFEYRIKQGKYDVEFYSTESGSVSGSTEIEITGDTEVSYKIYCHSDNINVETLYIENKGAVGENEAMVPSSASNCKFENYKDIEKLFLNAGFTNITTEIMYDIVLGWTEEGEVDKVSIDGKTNFNRGDVFSKDAAVVITYHMKEEDDPNRPAEEGTSETDGSTSDEKRPVFYSTNDYETAKKGNSGIFSYRYNPGSYYIYWIIDFDEGYAYYFTEGNGEETCDRVKIVSGDLNDKIIVTYNDGNTKWSYGLHFKYVNHPETLIMQDQNGFDYKYTTTDLDDALEIRNSRRIVNY